MKKIAVVYWSGTGNTKIMAEAVSEGIQLSGAEATLYSSDSFCSEMIKGFDGIAFGCPSMGAEELEESEFEPLFSSCESFLGEYKISLFGSYGWGDSEWMRSWEERCIQDNALLVGDSIICSGMPDSKVLSECVMLGKVLANAC